MSQTTKLNFNQKLFLYTSFGILTTSSLMYYNYYKKKQGNNLSKLSQKSLKEDPLHRSRTFQPLNNRNNVVIFSGSAHKQLSESVAKSLGTNLARLETKTFKDGECSIRIVESIRGKEVFIIQPTCPPVNENLVQLLLTISAMKRSSAYKITAVIPYYGYARADRKLSSRIPISAADVAKMLEVLGVDRVISVDFHCGQIQGFFGPSVPVDNLKAQTIMVDYLTKSGLIKNYNKLVIVSPDAGGVYRAKEFADLLTEKTGTSIAITMVVKERSRPNEVSKMELVGDVKDNDCIIIDDMIDTGGTLSLAAKVLKDNGARKVYAFATHGLFSGNGIEVIKNSVLDKVFVTDTIPPKDVKCDKIEYIPIGILIAEAIRRIQNSESLSEIFKTTSKL